MFLGYVSVQKVIRGVSKALEAVSKKITSPQICSSSTLARENPKKTHSAFPPLLFSSEYVQADAACFEKK